MQKITAYLLILCLLTCSGCGFNHPNSKHPKYSDHEFFKGITVGQIAEDLSVIHGLIFEEKGNNLVSSSTLADGIISCDVTIESPNKKDIRKITYIVKNTKKDSDAFSVNAADFLDYVASTPFRRTNPEAARNWFQQEILNMRQGTTEKIIGQVHYQLDISNNQSYTLTVTPAKWSMSNKKDRP